MSQKRGYAHAQKQHAVMKNHAGLDKRQKKKSGFPNLKHLTDAFVRPPNGRWLKLDDKVIR